MSRSILDEAEQVRLATDLIELGARLQFLEAEVRLSRERLLRLYKEIMGKSPPKGLLPFSPEWFMTWRANYHSSLFYNLYVFVRASADPGKTAVEHLIKAYRMYLAGVQSIGDNVELDFTRAHTLLRYFDSDILHLTPCSRCPGRFVTHAYDAKPDYVCVLCRPPSRAGKPGRRVKFTDLVDRAQSESSAADPGAAPAKHVQPTMLH